MLTINRFFTLLFVIIVLGLYGSFYSYYLKDKQAKAELIIEEFHRVLHELGYQLSTGLESLQYIDNLQSIINRKAAQNHLIEAITITDNNKILLTSDPAIISIPNQHKIHSNNHSIMDRSQMLTHQVHKLSVDFFEQEELIKLNIYIYPKRYDLNEIFSETTTTYVLYFFVPTLIIAIFLYWILKLSLINPLTRLQKFAYYHDLTPAKMKIRELESIRSSMDRTFQRLHEEKQALFQSARTDELSGLPNRYQLNERLTWLIDQANRNQSEFAYLFIDIDDFKKINDTLGHDAGDELLINLSGIMQSELRSYDIIARFGGDEFVVIIDKYNSHVELNHIIERVLNQLTQEQLIRQQITNVSASIGVALFPRDGETPQTLMKNADIAMYEAKKLGKNQIHYFTEALNRKLISQVEIENEIRKALSNEEFQLYYQPKIDLKTGDLKGVEALIRWIHPEKGMVSPVEFIPVAEQTGLILPLGDWVLEKAVREHLRWKAEYDLSVPISVNISAAQFDQKSFFSSIQHLINETGFEAEYLDIEVTESVMMADSGVHLNTLKKLKGLGISISLDDFGTGYSSLAYLKDFPVDYLKIDKSFVDDLERPSGKVFIETIINMAHTLKKTVIAEGVENLEQLDFLKELGCDIYQGYYFSAPVPADKLIELIRQEQQRNP